jgi:phosphomethylpyrimidine synthase
MCGPKFCSMKITQDVRDYVERQEQGEQPVAALTAHEVEVAMAAKAEEFKQVGDFYVGTERS